MFYSSSSVSHVIIRVYFIFIQILGLKHVQAFQELQDIFNKTWMWVKPVLSRVTPVIKWNPFIIKGAFFLSRHLIKRTSFIN